MDPYLAHLTFIISGGILAVIIPYYLKVRQKKLKFDCSYIYSLIITIIISSSLLVPENVGITGKTIVQDLILGFGLQSIVNKGNRERIRRKENNLRV